MTITVQPGEIHKMEELDRILEKIENARSTNTITVIVMPKSSENNYLAVWLRSDDKYKLESVELGDLYIIKINCIS